jgi:hypothetical protein
MEVKEEKLKQQLKLHGFRVTSFDPNSILNWGYTIGNEFYLRWQNGEVYIGVAKSFDRWANSRDFILHRKIEEIDLAILLQTCRYLTKTDKYNEGIALEYDIRGEYRKAWKVSYG